MQLCAFTYIFNELGSRYNLKLAQKFSCHFIIYFDTNICFFSHICIIALYTLLGFRIGDIYMIGVIFD